MKARAAKQYYTSFNAKAAKARAAQNRAGLKKNSKKLKNEWKPASGGHMPFFPMEMAAVALMAFMAARKRRPK